MTSMPKVPWTVRLGDIGELEVKTRLVHFSIATKYDRDVGIDFYCELLTRGSPSTPFYVQAKGSQHFDKNWSRSIPKSSVLYWLGQAHPVFLVVYDDKANSCYWMSIENRRYDFLSRMSSTAHTIRIQMDRSQVMERGANNAFIRQIKADTRSIMLWRGYPQWRGEGYVRRLPKPPRSEIEASRIKENVRKNMYSLIQHQLLVGDLDGAYYCCDYLVRVDKSHYNHFAWLGQINALRGNKEAAKESFDEALRICERDKVWPRKSMMRLKEAIRYEIRKLDVK